MTFKVSLNARSWTIVGDTADAALKRAIDVADLVDLIDAWEWSDGEVVVKPFYGMFYDHETSTVYDNGAVAIADWTLIGTLASRDVVRPTTKKIRGINGFLYEVSFYHDGTFMCLDRI